MKLSPEKIRSAANVLRGLSMDAVQKANSGHPGLPLGMADVAATLWLEHLEVSGKDPKWPDRDRFVLSGGHGSALLYALLHEAGFGVSVDDLKQFRQLGSITPGHPERTVTSGVEVTTGPLGQGLANAVGMAMSQAMLAARFNTPDCPLFDHHVYVFCGDGDLEEGISHEAASLAGTLQLKKLIVFYDSNHISIEGSTDDAFLDDTPARFKAYGWKVLSADGHDPADIDKAIRKAKKADAPTLIVCRTTIGFGSPNKAGKANVHGEPLGVEEVKLTKQALGIPCEDFYDPEDVQALFAARGAKMHRAARKWEKCLRSVLDADPAKKALYEALLRKEVPADLLSKMPAFPVDKPIATRAASGKVLQVLARELPFLMGGSADLGPSNKTWLSDFSALSATDFSGRNVHFGIRELGMAAIQNGIQADGFFTPFTATFFVFSDYMKPAIRIAALSKQQAVYVFSHDTFHVGEDGATHEPVEQLPGLRAMPGLTVVRPADATEMVQAWLAALRRINGPTAILCSRQNLPVIDRDRFAAAEGLFRGAYILHQNGTGTPELTVLASGGEVSLALEAALARPNRNIRVVSFPSWELFEEQPRAYREEVLPPACRLRLSVEAASSFGWSRYVGTEGRSVAIDHFGDSAPAGVLAKEFGFTAERVGAVMDEMLAR